jgi:hypothetical protein
MDWRYHLGNGLPWLLLAAMACGENGDGNNDTLFTGLSAVVILAVVLLLLWRAGKKRG